jgi:hypothetical protein
MGLNHSPKIVTNGLTLAYDIGNTEKSYRGAPTTNIHDNSMSIYNNVPDHVTATLVSTAEYYRGAVVWRLTLTPTTATGVSYLTGGNNPGIGVVTSGGGGLANRFTGHGIFYKSTVPMHSVPLFTNYSNIAGWGAGSLGSDRSVSMGEGWSRGEVIWYDTVTRSDGKYWAINPATATLNVPIVIFWAGPFKEDRNDSVHVASYTTGTRSNAQTLLDPVSKTTITANSVTYAANGFSFNGSTNFISAPNTNLIHRTTDFTYSCWVNLNAIASLGTIFENGSWTSTLLIRHETNIINIYSMGSLWGNFAFTPTLGVWYKLDFVRNGSLLNFYVNGVYQAQIAFTADVNPSANLYIGMSQHAAGQCFNGRIHQVAIYNRGLTAAEVQQNFNALRGRYGI